MRNIPDSSLPRDRLFWLRYFMVFLSYSRQAQRYYLKLGYNWFLSHPFQFIIHPSSFHSALYNLSYIKASLNEVQSHKERGKSAVFIFKLTMKQRRFLNLRSRRWWDDSFTVGLLFLRYPLHSRVSEAQCRSRRRDNKNNPSFHGESNPSGASHRPSLYILS
jgi:hypothetical protein